MHLSAYSGTVAKPLEDGDAGMRRWFALRVKSGLEKGIAASARGRGFEEFLPLCRSPRRWSDRIKSLEVPLFPGYVFSRLNPERRLPLLTIPGVLHVVGIGKVPVPIEDSEIQAIEAAVQSGLFTEPWPFLRIGERVLLEQGPLTGVEGILVKMQNQHRLVISITLLQRSVAVNVERDWIRPLGMDPKAVAESRRSGSNCR